MVPRDSTSRNDAPCDRVVAGPLGKARDRLRGLLVEEAETLVTILAWVEVAMECSVGENERKSVRQHCRQALRLINVIEQRHPEGELATPVAACIAEVRKDVERAIRRLDRE